MIAIEIDGINEIRQRFKNYPKKFDKAMDKTLEATLLTIHQEIPSYPSYTSPYTRTGTLGRSLGSGFSGGTVGKPDIYEKKVGSGYFEATFGTRLHYAKYVVGETTQARHMSHWWTLDGTVYNRVKPKIERLFEKMVETLARWLDG